MKAKFMLVNLSQQASIEDGFACFGQGDVDVILLQVLFYFPQISLDSRYTTLNLFWSELLGIMIRDDNGICIFNRAENRDDIAYDLATKKCCSSKCLKNLFEGDIRLSVDVIEGCLSETAGLDMRSKREYMMDKIRSTITNRDLQGEGGYARHNWKVGVAPTTVIDGVCRRTFRVCYNIGHTYVDEIVRGIKHMEMNSEPLLNDKTKVSSAYAENFVKMALIRGIILDKTQVAMMKIPNSPTSVNCYSWMAHHFELVGDQIPNSAGEIHLEPTDKQNIWKEYQQDMIHSETCYLGIPEFNNIWKKCFPYVKIREYKAVTGKCSKCTLLSHARRTRRDRDSMQQPLDVLFNYFRWNG
eukprot:gene13585-28845_t